MPRIGPTSHIYFSQRLRLHYVDWGNPDAPPMMLVHGGRDHCRNWDWVAEELAADYHIIAPDLRGHGDSDWMEGGQYTTVDYIYDIAQLLHQTKMTPVTIISHSLGGSVSLAYAGLYPETVSNLVSIEGMGPSPTMLEDSPETTSIHVRLHDWVQNLRQLSGRLPRRYPSLEEAFHRMQTENPHLSEEQARHLTIHGSNQNEDGTYSWKFDNYVRTSSPIGLSTRQTYELYQRISCPTLLIRGSESWASDPAKDGRAKYFDKVRIETISDAGHWVHHDQLEEFLRMVRDFLSSSPADSGEARDG
ncbi:MAG: alpha/beta hydrolase [Gammaproteobacteria bacterium]|nr:alpha/beta hydrolase [Gammaproteobacteria bacterium]